VSPGKVNDNLGEDSVSQTRTGQVAQAHAPPPPLILRREIAFRGHGILTFSVFNVNVSASDGGHVLLRRWETGVTMIRPLIVGDIYKLNKTDNGPDLAIFSPHATARPTWTNKETILHEALEAFIFLCLCEGSPPAKCVLAQPV
jgi:hypothetical protein